MTSPHSHSQPAAAGSSRTDAPQTGRSVRAVRGDTTLVSRLRSLRNSSKRKKKSPTGDMSLVEHLKELRRRVIISTLAVIAGAVVGFIWYQNAPGPIPPLGEILRGPYCGVDPELRADFTSSGECRLLATSAMEMFMLRLKIGALAGAVLAAPVWLYQIWKFITPGLLRNERRWTISFVTIAVMLFLSGTVLAYFSLSIGLNYLLTIGSDFQTAALTGQEYFSFVVAIMIIFGVSFEIPLVIVMLNLVGVLRYESVRTKRRHTIVVIFIFSALITPAQDPYSLTILAIAIILLVELAFQFCRINDKRRAKNEPDWSGLSDEEASPLDYHPERASMSGPVAQPESVSSNSRTSAQVYSPHSAQHGPGHTPAQASGQSQPTQQYAHQQQHSTHKSRGHGSSFDDIL